MSLNLRNKLRQSKIKMLKPKKDEKSKIFVSKNETHIIEKVKCLPN